MAQIKNNIIMKGASGKLGDTLVFRVKDGKTIIATKPVGSDKEPSEDQLKQREKFQEAILYAKSMKHDQEKDRLYHEKAASQPGKTAYNVAVADFFNAPDIREIDVSGYSGNIGDTIVVKVIDDVLVERVEIEIYNADSSLVEKGEAVQQDDSLNWVYVATAANVDTSGDRIVIKAYDLPDNQSLGEKDMAVAR